MDLDISSRHRGDLDGRLHSTHLPARVVLAMDAQAAASPPAQHLAWMLVNLLARQSDEVNAIELMVPTGVAVAGTLSPLIPSSIPDLVGALTAGIEQINPTVLTPATRSRATIAIRVGPGPIPSADFGIATSAIGWSGYVSQEPTAFLGYEDHPIGAYVAACLCAGEVFKFVRGVRPECGTFARSLWLDAFALRIADEPGSATPRLQDVLLRAAVVVGIGAVANGMLHTLYALSKLRGQLVLIDGDPEGITDTNLNRYALFGVDSLTPPQRKASAAAALFRGRPLRLTPVDDSWQTWISREHSSTPEPELVISAVDINRSRHAIQDALPRLILGASTNEMRAQVNLYDIVHGGACLRCRNRLEPAVADETIIEHLRALDPDARAATARQLGVDPTDLELFLSDPVRHCGTVSGATLQRFAGGSTEPEWSVGFVSVLAGVLLAAEHLKLSLAHPVAALTPARSQFQFQFWRPENRQANRLVSLPPEPGCLCQQPAFKQAVVTLYHS